MRSRLALISLVLLGTFLGLARPALADTQLDVDPGWGWRPRSDRWTPVFVTASDPKTRNVVLSIEWPEGGSYSMRIVQAMTIDATPRTFPILLPVHGWAHQNASFTLVDRDSGKSLAHFPKENGPGLDSNGGYPDTSAPFVGVSGATTNLLSLQNIGTPVNVSYLEPRRLPTTALGFDSLDVLVLNAPNLGRASFGPAALDEVQQQAIVDWVRAGGNLVIWPGDAGLASGPLVEALPGKLGVRENLELSANDLLAIGLPERFKSLPVYRVEPRAGAERVAMLNAGQASAYAIRLGLGKIVLLPINVGEMQFDVTLHSRNLWRPLLKGMVTFRGEEPPAAIPSDGVNGGIAPPAITYNNPNTDEGQAEKTASMEIANFLGDVPGAGQIGFSYIAIVLLGLMLVVGPVDWFVLKKLGRQPWTWVTTSGWIALVTTGAIFAGYLFKSGDLHYKTLQTIDQVGDATVAGTDYVSLYSSRTRAYEIKTDGDGWWQPTGFDEDSSSGLKLDVDFHQTSEGNTPEEMVVSVWSLRFLRGDHVGAGPAMLSADLKQETLNDGTGTHVFGTITNLSAQPLKNVRVSAPGGSGVLTFHARSSPTSAPSTQPALVEQIAAHATVVVETHLSPSVAPDVQADNGYGRYRSYRTAQTPDEANLWKSAADLNIRRGKQMAAMVATGKYAIIYAETDRPAPVATLVGPKALEQHYQFIRALVELHDREGK